MVDPDVGAAIKGDSIASPDILGVELANSDVLDDHCTHID